MPLVDYKNHKEGMPYELKFPFRPSTANNNNTKWPRTTSSPQTRPAGSAGTLIKAPPPDFSNSAVLPRSVSSDGRPLHPKRYRIVRLAPPCWLPHLSCRHASVLLPFRYSPGNDNYALACSIVMGRTLHNTNVPYADTTTSSHWRQKSMPEG